MRDGDDGRTLEMDRELFSHAADGMDGLPELGDCMYNIDSLLRVCVDTNILLFE